jgi:hypothetical protein
MRSALTTASSASNANRTLAIPVRQIFKLAIYPVSLPRCRFGTEVMPAAYNGKMRQHAAIPSPCAVAGSNVQIQIVGHIKAVAGGADQIACAARETVFHVLFPDSALILARDYLDDIRNRGWK